jgi:hypothetical protein
MPARELRVRGEPGNPDAVGWVRLRTMLNEN